MIAVRSFLHRRPVLSRPLLALGAGLAVMLAASAGVALGFLLDDPKPQIKTIRVDVPPACVELAQVAAPGERAERDNLDAAVTVSATESQEYGAAVLTRNKKSIDTATEEFDAALRIEQQARLDLASAQIAANAAAAECVGVER